MFADFGTSPLANSSLRHAPVQELEAAYLPGLPWNLRQEIMERMLATRTLGGRFVVPITNVTVFP